MPESGEDILAAGAVVSDDEGRVLLVQRGTEPQKGRWTVPGGRREPGETLPQTAAREVFEETGLTVAVGKELWSLRIPLGDGRYYEVHDFAATLVGGTLAAGDDADDVRWLLPEKLSQYPLTDGLLDYLRRAGIVPPDA
ncbi:ADP-ribose pyrophosphatase YjhB, NUDIX family [Paramicrobacterium humi]|uniref:ADP-ribose pyrophosphatase YjhB, NUDIX family n=1 Tax=Paramicrobacterium humi TaxID=640635 RepID=A0A1H4NXL7_9MICO|nr:NUDIX domain-containing protein [Microbacterium humi]SEC00007.1 ADP-ribose pyrophosphatase YjhB, NUDIX family [Microbacterium humi]